MIGLSNGSKQGDKSAQHSKLVRNVAGRIFPHENPLQPLRSPHMVAPPPKKYPKHQNPASYPGYTREFLYELPGPTNAWQLRGRGTEHACNWLSRYSARLQVVPHFSSGIVERAKCECVWKSPHARKGNTRQGECIAFSRVGWFSHALTFSSLYYPWGKIRDYTCSLYFACVQTSPISFVARVKQRK